MAVFILVHKELTFHLKRGNNKIETDYNPNNSHKWEPNLIEECQINISLVVGILRLHVKLLSNS